MTDQPTPALNTARKRFRDLGLSDIEALALLVPIVSEAYHEVADDAAEGATGTTWGSTPQEALAAFGRAYRSRGVECELRNAPPVPPFAKEQAAHEEHRQQLADALGNPEDTDWSPLIARARQVAAGRETWKTKAEEMEADRNRLANSLQAIWDARKAVDRVEFIADQFDSFARDTLKAADRKLYATVASSIRDALGNRVTTAVHDVQSVVDDKTAADPECSACGGNDPSWCPFCRARRAAVGSTSAKEHGQVEQDAPAAEGAPFGTDDCTCIPFTRQNGETRYCQPGDTVDTIAGWERGTDCPHHRDQPATDLDRERAAHEEHRRSLASLYDLPPDADWLQISAAATRVLLERDARHHALAAALGLRNTMGWATLVGTAAQVNKSATYHFERAKAADERLATAEAALTRVRDALDALGPLARRHIALALGDTDTTAAANAEIERSNGQGTAAVPAGGSRLFVLQRDVDHTGVSGTGIVADGVQFPDGTVVTRWRSATASTVVWARIENALTVHGYDGATRVVWSTPDTAPAIAQPAETAEPGAGTDGGEG